MNEPFYNNGLKFSCTQCSNCCRHDPGYVFLSYNDLTNLSQALYMSERNVIKKYCRIIDICGFERVSLIEKENYDCIFWSEKGCEIYEFRPLQCRSYPFWSPHLGDRQSWDELEESCPGVNKGKLHSKEVIDRWLEQKIHEGFIQVKNGKIIF